MKLYEYVVVELDALRTPLHLTEKFHVRAGSREQAARNARKLYPGLGKLLICLANRTEVFEK